MDYFKEGDLMDFLINLDENNSSISLELLHSIMDKLIDAMNYLHSNGILHNDIKPDNIFIRNINENNADVLIADLEFACYLNPSMKCTIKCGTLEYLPDNYVNRDSHSFEVDVFGLGKIFECIFQIVKYIPNDLKRIVDQMIEQDDSKSSTIKSVYSKFKKYINNHH